MERSVGIVSDIECPSRKGRCHTDSNYPKYSRDQSKTSAQNPTKHSRRHHAKDEYCDFGAIKDSLIRDQIVVGINDPKLRERLLRETDLTLEKAFKLCRITEQSKEQSKIFISPTTQTGNIDAVKKTHPPVDTAKSKSED